MNDETKAAVEWLRAESDEGLNEYAQRILAYLDGEPARLAAAREEQREACARHWEQTAESADDLPIDDLIPTDVIRATPLDATPLADELCTLRAENGRLRAELEQARKSADKDAERRGNPAAGWDY